LCPKITITTFAWYKMISVMSWAERGRRPMTVIRDLVAGQYSDPVGVIAFNTVEGWSRDISEDIAAEAAERIAMDGRDMPPWRQGFIDRLGSGRGAFHRNRSL
jgi:hypothetical protein